MVDTFSALADPTRRSIIEMLAKKGQLCATDICEKFQVTPPAISQHLKVLREAELVEMEKQGQQRIYTLNPDAVRELEEWAKKTCQCWAQRFDALDTLLKADRSKLTKHKIVYNVSKTRNRSAAPGNA
ncbi:MAG TPA: metalloregulator ArsR/SmtB family transcription factor [Candidatus Paceibacterota bacterium]